MTAVDLAMRRDPQTIFATHDLDPDRCDLFVEGVRDRQFLEWLVGSDKHSKATVTEMEFVDVPGTLVGGQRARLMAFAMQALEDDATIRFFADADFDRLTGAAVPANVWLTDGRDLEGYLIRADCVEKIWRLALNAEVDADALLSCVVDAAKAVTFLRLASLELQLDLPFNATTLRGRVTATPSCVEVHRETFARALLQNGEVTLGRLDELIARATTIAESAPEPECDLIHGHDFLELLTEILLKAGVSRRDAPKCAWASFERGHAIGHPALSEVLAYLRTCRC